MQILPAVANGEYVYVVISQDTLRIISEVEEIDFEEFSYDSLRVKKYSFSELEFVLDELIEELELKQNGTTNYTVLVTPFAYHIYQLSKEFSGATTPYFNFTLEQIVFHPDKFHFLTFDIPYDDVVTVYDGHKCIIEHFGKKMVICYQNGKLLHHLICCKKLEGLMAKFDSVESSADSQETSDSEEEPVVYDEVPQEPEKMRFSDTFGPQEQAGQFIQLEHIEEFLGNFECVAYRVIKKPSNKPPNPYVEEYQCGKYYFQVVDNQLAIRAKQDKHFQKIISMTWVTQLLVDGMPYLQAFEPNDAMFQELQRVNYCCTAESLPLDGYTVLVAYCENNANFKLIMMNKTAKRMYRLYEALRSGEVRIRVKNVSEWVEYSEQSEFGKLISRFSQQ